MGVKVEVGGGGISQSDADTRYVNATGDETVAGVKTFSSPVLIPAGDANSPGLAFSADADGTGTGLYRDAANSALWSAGGSPVFAIGGAGIDMISGKSIAWNSDTYLRRAAAGTLSQSNGANGQAVRIYNTTDSDTAPVNYERGVAGWASNEFRVGTEKGGTGTARATVLIADGSAKATIVGNTFYGPGTVAMYGYLYQVAARTSDGSEAAGNYTTVFTNEGAAVKPNRTLPGAGAGGSFTFIVQDTDGIRITAAVGDTIRMGPKVTAAAGYIESTTVGSTVTLIAINATEWIATSFVGTWTDGTFTATGGTYAP
jgi:hypothetical protein